ncbi:MAG: nuclear transport factor 2 family protein [Acidiferrobacterales bacterium]|nr:nuclear transport factor 2 family protein [Acidiferrobacterales bacterium]
MMDTLTEIKLAWRQFDLKALDKLEPLYHPRVKFIEPAGEIMGREAVFHQFRQNCTDLIRCQFEFDDQLETVGVNQACLVWEMHFQHKKLRKGGNIVVPGTTLLQFDEQITLHRDWFDLGATIYEHVPLLGGVIRGIKSRLHEAVH